MERERTMADLYGPPCPDGHSWQHIGGKNAGCHRDCACSVPVNRCVVCGDCDYGDNEDATRTISECEYRATRKAA